MREKGRDLKRIDEKISSLKMKLDKLKEGEGVIPCDFCDSFLDMSGNMCPGWQINGESTLLLHY